MNSKELLKEFGNEISNYLRYILRDDISKQAFELQGKLNCILYLKTRTTEKANWGITNKVILKLKAQNKPWFMILLSLKPYTGYILTEKDVGDYIGNYWHLNQDGDYKTATSFDNDKWFNNIEQMLSKIKYDLKGKTIIDDDILDKAISETTKNSPNRSVESSQHKKLKELVASNPFLIGLENVKKSQIEYSYPSGDRVDVIFELSNNCFSVVEIEIEGLTETVIGLFQVVKYKALQEALLLSKGLNGKVTGFLVAKSIHPQTKKLAELLSINIVEINTSFGIT